MAASSSNKKALLATDQSTKIAKAEEWLNGRGLLGYEVSMMPQEDRQTFDTQDVPILEHFKTSFAGLALPTGFDLLSFLKIAFTVRIGASFNSSGHRFLSLLRIVLNDARTRFKCIRKFECLLLWIFQLQFADS
jgi:hypothetical protein